MFRKKYFSINTKNMKITPTTCLKLYNTNLYIDADGKSRICCKQDRGHRFVLDKETNRISYVSKIRSFMEKWKRHPSCMECYSLEDNWVISVRQKFNDNFWSKIIKPSNDLEDKMRYLEISFSNTCNLACRMCKSKVSTGRMELDKKLWFFVYKPVHLPQDALDYIYNLDNIAYLKHIEIIGWEPMLEKEHFKFLVFLIESWMSSGITLWYNSNLMTLPEINIKNFNNIFDIWKRFKNVKLRVSLDWYKEVNDYIRIGSKWDNIISNIFKVQRHSNIDISISPTIQVDNILNIPSLLLFIESNCLKTSIWPNNYVIWPSYYCVQNLPNTIKKYIKKRYIKFSQKQPEVYLKYKREIEWILTYMDWSNMDVNAFREYINVTKKINSVSSNTWKNEIFEICKKICAYEN